MVSFITFVVSLIKTLQNLGIAVVFPLIYEAVLLVCLKGDQQSKFITLGSTRHRKGGLFNFNC